MVNLWGRFFVSDEVSKIWSRVLSKNDFTLTKTVTILFVHERGNSVHASRGYAARSVPEFPRSWTNNIVTITFSAVHYLKVSEQRWFSSEQRWKRKFSELKLSAETALFHLWFSLKHPSPEWKFLANFSLFFKIFLSTSISRHIILVSTPFYENNRATKIYFSNCVQANNIKHTWIFGFTLTAQVTKQIWFNFSRTFLRL